MGYDTQAGGRGGRQASRLAHGLTRVKRLSRLFQVRLPP